MGITENKIPILEEMSVATTEIPVQEEIVDAVMKKKKNVAISGKYIRNHTPSRLSWCVRMAFYYIMGFEFEQIVGEDFYSKYNMFRGNALHNAFERIYPWSELPLKLPVTITNGKEVIVSGRLDLYRPNDATVIDLKTTKYVKWQQKSGFLPRAKDINQLQIYSVLYKPILPIKKLELIYADMADIISFDVPIAVNAEKWLINRLDIIDNAVDSTITPIGEVSKLCDYCPYQTRCHGEPGGITTSPKSHPKEEKL